MLCCLFIWVALFLLCHMSVTSAEHTTQGVHLQSSAKRLNKPCGKWCILKGQYSCEHLCFYCLVNCWLNFPQGYENATRNDAVKEITGKIMSCFRNVLYLLCFKKIKQCLIGSHTDIHAFVTSTPFLLRY